MSGHVLMLAEDADLDIEALGARRDDAIESCWRVRSVPQHKRCWLYSKYLRRVIDASVALREGWCV